MDTAARLLNLPQWHPCLIWDQIIAATAAVVHERTATTAAEFNITVEDVPGFGNDELKLSLQLKGISDARIAAVKRTFETARLIEFAAIGLAGMVLHVTGGHEIREVAWRGTGADYLVDEFSYFLEISGRSRNSDFSTAWNERWTRLMKRRGQGFFVFVVEFETNTGRLAFHE